MSVLKLTVLMKTASVKLSVKAKMLCWVTENPEATKEAIRDGWFYTGDSGFLMKTDSFILPDAKRTLLSPETEKMFSLRK